MENHQQGSKNHHVSHYHMSILAMVGVLGINVFPLVCTIYTMLLEDSGVPLVSDY